MDITWYDAIILALLVFCTWRGAVKGFAWQLATIGAIVLCFIFAQSASLAIAPLIGVDPPLDRWIAMFVLYIGASFASFAVARLIRGVLEKLHFEEFDRHLGAVFGFVKGIAFALVITFFAVTLSESLRGEVLHSYSGHYAGRILATIHPVLPDRFHDVIDPYMEELGERVVHNESHDYAQNSGHATDNQSGPAQNTSQSTSNDNSPQSNDTQPHQATGSGDFGNVPWQSGNANPAPTKKSSQGLTSGTGAKTSNQIADGFGPQPKPTSALKMVKPVSQTQQPLPKAMTPTASQTQTPAPQTPASQTPAPQKSPSNLPSSVITDIEGVLNNVPDDLKQAASTAWSNTAPEDRDELLSSLRSSVPAVVSAVSKKWGDGKPDSLGKTALKSSGEILTLIAGVYAADEASRQKFLKKAKSSLVGVPDDVAKVVLHDWYSDLFGDSTTKDPDPGTDLSTPFDERIRRQLKAFGVGLDKLGTALRNRLEGTRQ